MEPVYNSYEKSFQAFKALLTTDYKIEAYPPAIAENQTFGKEFPGALIHKPQYKNCVFVQSRFESSDGALSRFHDCIFNGCLFDNCDLRYCDILHSDFQTSQDEPSFTSCNFSFGNFINSHFSYICFSGCSFRQMQFEGSSFISCKMQHCSIEQSNIKDCRFENLDLRKTGVRYCTFEKTVFKDVIFHILDLPKNYGLIQQLQKAVGLVSVAYKNDKTMSLNEAIRYLRNLIPYYLEKSQFFELINVYAAYEKYEEIFNILPYAFENVITACDFAALLDLCSLIVKLKICTDKQLREFYALIKQFIVPDKFPHYLRKNYNTYIENIRYILVDNPYNRPEANILLKTNIHSLNDGNMARLLRSIEANIKELAPSVDSTFQLTHHSPYDVIITLFGAMPDILRICQTFYYSLGGIKTLLELQKSRKEKVVKATEISQSGSEKTDQEMARRIELSVGKIFSFKYEKDFIKHVESLEYVVK